MPEFTSRTLALLILGAGVACAPAVRAQVTPGADAAHRAATLRMTPGDRIAIHLVGEPALSDTVMVTERGEAPFAKLGLLPVTRYTISELQDTLRSRYAQYLRNPALEIIVLRRVAVNGEVKNPDLYLVDISMTLRDVIARAGGITENGNPKKVYVVRGGTRTQVEDWQSDATHASDLQSGDQVLVGRRSWWSQNLLPVISTSVLVASVLISATR